MTIIFHADSDSGLNKRNLEDAYFIDEAKGLFIICDGMGGTGGGKIASAIAIKSVIEYWELHEINKLELNNEDDIEKFKFHIREAIQLACKNIFNKSKEKGIWIGMGASLLLTLVKGSTTIIGHAGDCRCYLISEKTPYLLTEDHTMEKEMLQVGLLKNEQIGKTHYSKILTRSVGTHESVLVDLIDIELNNKDHLALFTNGVHKYFKNDNDIIDPVDSENLRLAVSKYIFNANQRGGQDDMAAMVLQFKSEKKQLTGLNQIKIETILKLPFWQNTSLRRANIIKNYFKTKEIHNNENIEFPNIDKGALIYVIEGSLEVTEENKTIKQIDSSNYFGEKYLIIKPEKKVLYKAKKNTKILYLTRTSFKKLCKKYPKAGLYLLKKLSEKIITP